MDSILATIYNSSNGHLYRLPAIPATLSHHRTVRQVPRAAAPAAAPSLPYSPHIGVYLSMSTRRRTFPVFPRLSLPSPHSPQGRLSLLRSHCCPHSRRRCVVPLFYSSPYSHAAVLLVVARFSSSSSPAHSAVVTRLASHEPSLRIFAIQLAYYTNYYSSITKRFFWGFWGAKPPRLGR